MNVHVLQHVALKEVGRMAQWLDAAGLQTSHTRVCVDDPFSELKVQALDGEHLAWRRVSPV